LSKKQGASII